MSDPSILREFLISLGFKIDDKSATTFDKSVKGVTAQAVALGVAIEETAKKFATQVLNMAQSLDTLYFTSRRVNSSAENIKAFGFAIEQLGGNAEGAQNMLEGIASFMRSNPAGEGYINSLGVATRDLKGNLRDTELIAEDLGKSFAGMPFYVAKVRASMLGIDEKTLLALIQGPGKETEKYRDFANSLGLGLDNGADAANRFGTAWRDLRAEAGLFFTAVAVQALPTLQKVADGFKKWAPEILKVIGTKESLQIFGDVVVGILGAIAIATIAAVWPWLLLAGAIAAALAAYQNWDKIAPKVHKDPSYDKAQQDAPWYKKAYNWMFWGKDHPGKLGKREDNAFNSLGTGLEGPGENLLGKSGGKPIKGNNGSRGDYGSQVADFMAKHGFSADQSRGIGAGVSAEGGGLGAAANGAFGIGQWRGARKQALFARYGRNPTLQNQLDFLLWELNGGDQGGSSVRAQTSASGAMAAYLRDFMRPGNGLGGDLWRGQKHLMSSSAASNVSIHQKTEINVNGQNDPKAAGKVVAASQERVNGNLVRNLKTAVA